MEAKLPVAGGPAANGEVPRGMVFDSPGFRCKGWTKFGPPERDAEFSHGSDADIGWPRLAVNEDPKGYGGSIPSRSTKVVSKLDVPLTGVLRLSV